MDAIARLNTVMTYVEDHLQDEIREEEISRLIACPYPVFQAMFSQIAAISFSEYVRRRKLTCAAFDLMDTGERILDIALKYGYQSADAFSAAFKRLHGIAPVQLRRSETDLPSLAFYCPLSFAVQVKGVEKMDVLRVQKGPFSVMGVRRTTPYGGGTWAVVKSDGSNNRINRLAGKFFDLGLCFGFHEDGSNDYMCAVDWDPDTPPAEGMEVYHYPAACWLRFTADGTITGGTLGAVWSQINGEFLPSSPYRKLGLPTIEKYILWNEAEDRCLVEIWIPIQKKDAP